MRGKSATRSAASISSSNNDESNTGTAPAASLPSLTGKRAADMFASYSNGNLDFGSGIDGTDKNNSSSAAQDAAAGSTSLADISDGAKRLAQELDQYITRGPDKTGQGNAESGSALSDDAIADLQLATARKLREVGQLCELF